MGKLSCVIQVDPILPRAILKLKSLSGLWSVRDVMMKEGLRDALFLTLTMEGGKGERNKGCRWLVEAGKGVETDSPLECPERNAVLLALILAQ